MFQRMIDDFKDSTGSALRLTSLAAMAAFCLFITTSFLCAAAFVLVLDRYGLVQALFTGAAIFFLATLIAAACYMMRKRLVEVEVKETVKSPLQSALADPMLVATGIQLIRAVGIKRLIPILAIGGLALGYFASRNAAAQDETPAE